MSTHSQAKIPTFLVSLAWVVTICFLLLNSYASKQTTSSHLGISATLLTILFLTLFLSLRLTKTIHLHPLLFNFTRYLILPVSLTLGLLLGILETVFPPNYLYSVTRLNPDNLLSLAHFSFAAVLINSSYTWLKNHSKTLLILAPIWLILIDLWTQGMPFDLAVAFTHEDGPVETLQNLIIISAFSLSLFQTWLSNRHKSKTGFLVFLLITCGFFFFLMEEISWGQRILNLQTPQQLKAINVQEETNLHNIGILNQLQLVGYFFLSSLVVFPTLASLLHWTKVKSWYAPPIAVYYMLLPFIATIFFIFSLDFFIHAEVIEVLFYAGLLLWLWDQTNYAKPEIIKALKQS